MIERFEQGVTIAPTLQRLRTDDPTDPVFREAVEAAVLDLLEEPDAEREGRLSRIVSRS